jgi:hypothetical protein
MLDKRASTSAKTKKCGDEREKVTLFRSRQWADGK